MQLEEKRPRSGAEGSSGSQPGCKPGQPEVSLLQPCAAWGQLTILLTQPTAALNIRLTVGTSTFVHDIYNMHALHTSVTLFLWTDDKVDGTFTSSQSTYCLPKPVHQTQETWNKNSRRGSCLLLSPPMHNVQQKQCSWGVLLRGGPGCLTLMAQCWTSCFEDSHRKDKSASKINRQFSSAGYVHLWPQRSHQY